MNAQSIRSLLRDRFVVQLFLRFSAVVTLTTGLFTFAFVYYQGRITEQRLIEEGRALTKVAAATMRLGVFTENTTIIDRSAAEIFQSPQVQGIRVIGPHGRIIHSVRRDGGPAGEDHFKATVEDSLVQRQVAWLPAGRNRYIFYEPVLASPEQQDSVGLFFDEKGKREEEAIGAVLLEYDFREPLRVQRRVTLFNSLFLALAISLLVNGAAVPLVRRAMRPIDRLTKAAEEMREKGTAVKPLEVDRNDELGKLTQSFNAMAEALRQKESERQRLEEHMRQAQKMEAIGLLSGGLAHDFNNLLTAILGHTQIVSAELGNSPLANNMKQIEACAYHAAGITRNLLTFSRKAIVNKTQLDLGEVLQSMASLIRSLIPENISLNILTDPTPVCVVADRPQIQQCILNLALNAKDAMPDGGSLTIAVSKRPGDNGSPAGTLDVSDTGGGIPQDIIGRIFEPFFTTKEIGEGTGLGLSIVYGIVQGSGGKIGVKSDVGAGTAFSITLPLIKEGGECQHLQYYTVETRAGDETILLVEDNTFVRDILSDIIRKRGYKVLAAADGEEALRIFRENAASVALVLCDLIMPKKSGKQVYDEITARSPEIIFVFMSGYSGDLQLENNFPVDVQILRKPISGVGLLKMIRELLDSRLRH